MTPDTSDQTVDLERGSTSAWPPDWSYYSKTAHLRVLPNFVILGTARGGTTSLFNWLGSHPDVTPSLKKETHYFDRHYAKGLRWYRSHFPLAGFHGITGEATPYLLFHPLAPQRVAKDLPSSTRFIVLLRNPVHRALSHYWWGRDKGRETESFERAVHLEPERLAGATELVLRGEPSENHRMYSYLARGKYAGQLRSWFSAVGRERILIVESESLYGNPTERGRVLDWLDLHPHDQEYPVANRADRSEETSPEFLAYLSDYFATDNQDLFELLGYELWVDGGGTH